MLGLYFGVYESAPRGHVGFFCFGSVMSHWHTGNFSGAREAATGLCCSGDELTAPGLGIFLGSFMEVKAWALEEEGVMRKSVACQACP